MLSSAGEETAKTDYIEDRMKDSDGDGLADFVELEIGTNPEDADSDKDKVMDSYEYLILATDPLNVDTDGNGVWDGDEDFDGDGINNLSEFEHGTDPFAKDTDEDGLNDYEELFEYGTNPLVKDTDEEGLWDGDEILLGFDPLNQDTDGDGIPDSEEKVQQQKCLLVEEAEKPVVTKITVDMTVSGNIEKNVDIENMYQIDVLSSDVVGLLSVPVEITTEQTFEQAVITFHYDETALGDIPEENLAVMWHDEENHWYEVLDVDSVIDMEANTVSYTTTHFSTYMLVDKEEWYQAWKEDLNYRTNDAGESASYDIAFVIDTSMSMWGASLNCAKRALNGFVDTMAPDDKAGLIEFSDEGRLVASVGTSVYMLKKCIGWLEPGGGTNVDSGLKKAIIELDRTTSDNQKIIILVCDGDVNYNGYTIDEAVGKGIKIFTINVGYENASGYLKIIAEKTGGEYYYCKSSEEIETMFGEISIKTIENIDTTDTDSDGLYDVFEKVGFRLENGRILTSDATAVYTDADGLTDYDEIGIIYNYNTSEPKLLNIGKGEKTPVIYVQAYSDPRKPDTDFDGLTDDVDPYPWKKTCNVNSAASEHEGLVLNEDGYYVCQTCGARIKSPELQDYEVLSSIDYATLMACVMMEIHYIELVSEVYGDTHISVNQKLLQNKMAEIRQKEQYRNCYEYSDLAGVCINERHVLSTDYMCIVNYNEMSLVTYGFYLKIPFNFASYKIGVPRPFSGFLVSLIGAEIMRSDDETAGLTPMDIANFILAAATGRGPDEFDHRISNLTKIVAGATQVNDLLNCKISLSDYEIRICLHRSGSDREIRQSQGSFVVSPTGLIKWMQYTEFGYESWEARLK